ncbi:MAG: hypothetical protein F6K61_21505 [Sphaerospermopsis sp. SIO1G1]|nr:hypothetical protein [Sphaerospermopsis sp. SIO1G1]
MDSIRNSEGMLLVPDKHYAHLFLVLKEMAYALKDELDEMDSEHFANIIINSIFDNASERISQMDDNSLRVEVDENFEFINRLIDESDERRKSKGQGQENAN